jgi:hypothetical protein
MRLLRLVLTIGSRVGFVFGISGAVLHWLLAVAYVIAAVQFGELLLVVLASGTALLGLLHLGLTVWSHRKAKEALKSMEGTRP